MTTRLEASQIGTKKPGMFTIGPRTAQSPSRTDWQNAASEARQCRDLIEKHGLRATRQRLGFARLLFAKGHRHVTADALAAEAKVVKIPASLATVYNILNCFAEVGLLRALPIEGTKTVFDTNTTDHAHFYFEETGGIADIEPAGARLAAEIEPPEGYEIARVDVVVRLRRKATEAEPGEVASFGALAAE